VVSTFCEEKVRLEEESVAAGPPVVPVPVRLTDCGLPVALSATEIAAVRVPESIGANTAVMVQFAPAATETPQLLVCEKSPEFVPVIVMLEIANVVLPVLNSVTPPGALVVPTDVFANAMFAVLKLTAGAVPTPVSAAVWGLPLALSRMDTIAWRVAATLGRKLTLIEQLVPSASKLPQLFV